MCGIVGYIGDKQAQPILLEALSRLEYRGYDSSGIAVQNVSSLPIQVLKDSVRVNSLQQRMPFLPGFAGIGHTRWATHGEPSRINAHPHCDCNNRIAVVHNGIITNYQTLKMQLIREGHHFVSETDTEVIPHLIEKYYLGNIKEATVKALKMVQGSYAIAVLSAVETKLIAAKNGNPLIIGIGDRQNIVASDIPAILEHTNRVIYLEDGDIAEVTAESIKISNCDQLAERPVCQIAWNTEAAQKGGYEHFMLKEIHEQPRAIRDTISGYLNPTIPGFNLDLITGNKEKDLLIIACGTSYHAGLIGKYLLEGMLNIPVRVELASETSHLDHTNRAANVIALTQSGETADVLNCLKEMKNAGSYICTITNVRGSSASRYAHETIYTYAGPEISVAATKSFISQLTVLYQLALSHPKIDLNLRDKMALELRLLPNLVQRLLDNDHQIANCAEFLSQYKNAFFIGRGINYPIALEGALKMKEISYIYAEGYAAGELKHGPFSLLVTDTPVIAIVARDKNYDSMVSSIEEVKSRKSPVIALVNDDDYIVEKLADWVIKVPPTPGLFSPFINTVALQLLSYYTARFRGCPIDFPRNLAKSVTVE
jgi:glutamine---fructose-6-phosphate transaminase (isomerizing)